MNAFKPLTSAIHFHTAALDRTLILVFQAGELIGSGKIDEIRDETVKIRDEWYLRRNCTFVYAK
jgi:hypothetical protein